TPARPLRLVHTSDVHLDDGVELPARALAGAVDATLAIGADLLVVAGDLFDHNRVSDAVVERFLREADRLPAPPLVLPGNHDAYGADSVYRRDLFRGAAVRVLDGEPLLFPELQLEVWGRPVVDHSPANRPLHGVPARQGDGWFVVVAHGHFDPELERQADGPVHHALRSSPISVADVAGAGCDYVA